MNKRLILAVLLLAIPLNAFDFDFDFDMPAAPSFNGSFGGIIPGAIDMGPLYFVAYHDPGTLSILHTAKVSTSTRDEIVSIPFGLFGTSNASLNVYQVDGIGMRTTASYSGYKHNGRSTTLVEAVEESQGSLLMGGSSGTGSTYNALLASSTFVRGSLSSPFPSNIGTSTAGRFVSGLQSANLNGDSWPDTIVLLENSTSHANKLWAKIAGEADDDYTLAETRGMIKSGDFAATSGEEFAYVGTTSTNRTRIYLFSMNPGPIQNVASAYAATSTGLDIHPKSLAAADLDGDGRDELIVAGYTTISVFSMQLKSDVVAAYKYSSGSWRLLNEYAQATGAYRSEAVSVGAADFNLDGNSDVVAIITNETSSSVNRIRAYLYLYNATGNKFELYAQETIGPTSPTPSNYFEHVSSTFGDFTGDGMVDLAIEYVPEDFSFVSIDVFEIGGDSSPPTIAITSPPLSTYYNNVTLTTTANVEDFGTIKSSTVKAKLSKPGYDSGFHTAISMPCLGACDPGFGVYKANFSLVGLAAGNYTLYWEAKDGSANRGTKNKTIQILSSAPAGPAPAAADITLPAISATSDREEYTNDMTAYVTVTANDAGGISTAFVSAEAPDGSMLGQFEAIASMPPTDQYTASIDLSGWESGNYRMTAFAVDSAGNINEFSFLLSVTEAVAISEPEANGSVTPTPEPPEITCPVDESICGPGTVFDAATCKCNPAVQAGTCNVDPAACGANTVFDEELCQCVPEGPNCSLDPSSCGAGLQLDAALCKCVVTSSEEPPPVAPPPSQPQFPEETEQAKAQSDNKLYELAIKIAAAKDMGIDTAPITESLERAQELREKGRYTEAALEAQKGISDADSAISAGSLPKSLTKDITASLPQYWPYLLGAVVIVLILLVLFGGMLGLGGILGGMLLFGKKSAPAAPVKPEEPAPSGKRNPKSGN